MKHYLIRTFPISGFSECNLIMAFTLFILATLLHYSLSDLIVNLPNGKVQGTSYTSANGKTFYSWRGIPYAQPPVGSLRFMPPVKADKWDGVLDATKDNAACIMFLGYPGDPIPEKGYSEDCLYINVYTPFPVNGSLNASTSVMLWIYGGGFASGTAIFSFYDPTPIIEENVIFVSFNYRLGTFGFLSTQDDVILGNAGLKDQLLALKWVRENIAFFGGNPDDITIFGESAGGASVAYHLLSPLSRGLFAAAILESGTGISLPANSQARNLTVNLAKKIDNKITDNSTSEEIKKVLQAVSSDVILNYTLEMRRTPGPVLEVETENSFLTKPLYEELAAGNCSKVPIIIGNNGQESISFFQKMEQIQQAAVSIDQNRERMLPRMNLKEGANKTELAEKVHELYVGKNGLLANNLSIYLEYSSDNMLRGIYKHASTYSKFAPTYMYQFSFYGTRSQHHVKVPDTNRVGHSDELAYIFNITPYPIKTEKDFLARKRTVKLWTNFAKTKNPTPEDDEVLQNVKWEVVTPEKIQYLDIDENLQMKPNRLVKVTKFWDDLFETYANHPYYY